MATQYRIRSSSWLLPPRVVAFRGREGVSELYTFDVGVVWTSELPFAPEEAVGEAVTLEIEPTDGAPHVWHGVISEITLVLEEGTSSYWRLTFGPRLGTLALTHHSRIFTDVTIPDVVTGVLADEGLPGGTFAMRTTGTYPERAHVCQYRESSLDFVRRLLEREGVYFGFEHDDGDAERVAFFDDSSSAPTSIAAVRYVGMGAGSNTEGSLTHFRSRRALLPRSVRLHDHDPSRPRLDVSGRANVTQGWGGEVVRWGDNVASPEEATRYARLRSEELLARRDVFEGGGPLLGLRPGSRFGLVEHATLDGTYFVEKLRHRAAIGHPAKYVLRAFGFDDLVGVEDTYRVDLVAVPAAVRYRPVSATPWPRIAGVVTALVDGPAASPYAQIDDEGRYRVSVHFDEGDTVDGSRSTWVRMLQPHAGLPEGMHFPLRKGTEVALIFLGGDPDRPFIVGAAPNPEKPSPVTRANATKNVIQTGSLNRLEMDDVAGAQTITLSTPTERSSLHLGFGPKSFVLRTDGRGRIHTGEDFDVDVRVNKTEDVDHDVTETYDATRDLTVGGPVTETLGTSLTWKTLGPVTHTWAGPFVETIDGHVKETFGATLTTTVNAALTTLTYAGGLQVNVSGDVVERFTASQSTTVDGPLTLLVGGHVTERFGSARRHVMGTYYLGVSGTYKVLTPNMIVDAPAWQFISNVAKKIASTEIVTDAFTKKIQYNVSSKRAVSLSATGVSLAAYGVSFGFFGQKVDVKPQKQEKTAAKTGGTAARVDKFKLLVITGGPKVS